MLPRSRAGRRARGIALSTAKTRARAHALFRRRSRSLTAEIGRIVAERQALRAAGADAATLEENRRRLAAAQSQLSQLLIERHLPQRRTA